jgi:hypothetical protein
MKAVCGVIRSRLLVCAFSLLLAVARSSAIDFTRTEIPGTGVALNLPTDWEPIPPEAIQRQMRAVASSIIAQIRPKRDVQ